MSKGLFDYEADGDACLNGVECRILRALLGLERRHVAVVADVILGINATTERVTQWERSRERGYPETVVALLRDFMHRVGEYGGALYLSGDREGACITLRAPRGVTFRGGLDWVASRPSPISAAAADRIDAGAGDFWQRLDDAALIEAARRAHAEGLVVRIARGT